VLSLTAIYNGINHQIIVKNALLWVSWLCWIATQSTLSDRMITSGAENGAEGAENRVERWLSGRGRKKKTVEPFYFLFVL